MESKKIPGDILMIKSKELIALRKATLSKLRSIKSHVGEELDGYDSDTGNGGILDDFDFEEEFRECLHLRAETQRLYDEIMSLFNSLTEEQQLELEKRGFDI